MGARPNPRKLCVLNTALEVVYSWPNAVSYGEYVLGATASSPDVILAWLPCGALVAAVQPRCSTGILPPQLDVWWHACHKAGCGMDAVDRVRRQLEDIASGEDLQALSVGSKGMAALTKLSGQSSGRLHIWLGDMPGTSILLPGRMYNPKLVWSPAGDCLLLLGSLTWLISASCSVLLQLPDHRKDSIAFSPDGRHVAALNRDDSGQPVAVSLELYMSSDGSKVFSTTVEGSLYYGYLTFSTDGSRVLLSSKHTFHLVDFGHGSGGCSSLELCSAVSAACQSVKSGHRAQT